MKTIIIEPVSNGWIVTERFAGNAHAVYNNLSDLTDDLPRLLEVHGPTAQYHDLQWQCNPPRLAAPTPLEISALRTLTGNPPPLAARDSDGGNTGL